MSNNKLSLDETYKMALHALALTQAINEILSDEQKSKIPKLLKKYFNELTLKGYELSFE